MTNDDGGDQGSMTLEMVLWVPVLLFVLFFAAVVYRISAANLRAQGAAADAARAVSIYRGALPAQNVAAQAAEQSLATAGVTCTNLTVRVGGDIAAGGTVTVTVACTADLSDVAIGVLPGSKTLTATASSPIDRTRT